jgi:hypothetical protein
LKKDLKSASFSFLASRSPLRSFTFYKTAATIEYIRESAKGTPIPVLQRRGLMETSPTLSFRFSPLENSMEVQRHPRVEDDPSQLTAYDICKIQNIGMYVSNKKQTFEQILKIYEVFFTKVPE